MKKLLILEENIGMYRRRKEEKENIFSKGKMSNGVWRRLLRRAEGAVFTIGCSVIGVAYLTITGCLNIIYVKKESIYHVSLKKRRKMPWRRKKAGKGRESMVYVFIKKKKRRSSLYVAWADISASIKWGWKEEEKKAANRISGEEREEEEAASGHHGVLSLSHKQKRRKKICLYQLFI